MLKKFKNAGIKTKIAIGFTITHTLLGVVVILSLVCLSTASDRYDSAYQSSKLAGEAADASKYYYHALEIIERSILSGDRADDAVTKAACNDELVAMQAKFADITSGNKDEDCVTCLDALKSELKIAYPQLMAVMDATWGSDKAPADKEKAKAMYLDSEFISHNERALGLFDELNKALLDDGTSYIVRVTNNNKFIVILVVGALIVSILISVFGVTRVIVNCIRIPVSNLVDAAEKLAVGNVNVTIEHYYDDEIGELSDSFARMVENTKNQANVTKELAQGNYCIEVTPLCEEDLMGNSFAGMIKEENRVMGGINQAVSEIRTGSQEVAAASQSLAQGSTEQASAIQQITASINDITERTKVNASDARSANDLVVNAKNEAIEGNHKMQEMIGAMSEINESSENISKIIKVIDDIAFQTNILALNAAVEAARAGQHGRGFAVVADEVRNLAGKSAQAASETAEMIEDSIGKVNKGSKLAEETAAALESIVGEIDRIVEITNSIAVASNDQATAISQIDQAIGQVSQVVQTNSATSEECAAASEELSAQAGKLREMISRYRLQNMKISEKQPEEQIGLPEDEINIDIPPVISLDDGFGKY